MYLFPFCFLLACIFAGTPLAAERDSDSIQNESSTPLQPFTGKVAKNKVRLRLQPSLDSPVIREVNRGDLLLVVGENEEFYALQTPADLKGYIYRTYILDNTVEGNRVNIRLEPNLDSPVVAQLNAGDKVDGTISQKNNKWMEVALPRTARLYIAKDYVEKVGDANLLTILSKRRDDVNRLLNDTYQAGQQELQKPFPESQSETILASYKKIIDNYADFPDQNAKAKELLGSFQEQYLKKKIAYLEDQHKKNTRSKEALAANKSQQDKQQQNRKQNNTMPAKMAMWVPVERSVHQAWCEDHGNCSIEQFYATQQEEAISLRGLIEPYNRSVRNKPGDYMLVNSSHQPIAYLYSTHVNLQDLVGHHVTVSAAPRPNNQFAFPAYYVLSVNE